MVSPTGPTSEPPEPFEPEKEEADSQVPEEIVSENLPIPEPEKELEEFEISVIDKPSDVESATTEIATETLQIDTPEKIESPEEIEAPEVEETTELEEAEAPEAEESEEVPESPQAEPPEDLEPPEIPEAFEPEEPETTQVEEEEVASDDSQVAISETEEAPEVANEEVEEGNSEFITAEEPEDADLTDAEFEEAEELEEEEPAEAEDVEEEEDLNLIVNALSDDYVDPNGQEFKKLLEEILPFDDTMHILPQERLDDAAHFFDIERKVFYTHEPLQQKDLKPFRNIFLQLDLTDDEIQAIQIIRVPHNQWEAFIHKLKNHN